MSEIAPENEEEYQERRKELIEDAKQEKQQLDAKQNEALDAIAEGKDYEAYETVDLGELQLEVKAWLPGDIEKTVLQLMSHVQNGNMEAVSGMRTESINALAGITTNDHYDKVFWETFHEKWGLRAVMEAIETCMSPAFESMEELGDGVESFPKRGQGDGFRDGVQYDERSSERD